MFSDFGIKYHRFDSPSTTILWFKNGEVARHYERDGYLDFIGTWTLQQSPAELGYV